MFLSEYSYLTNFHDIMSISNSAKATRKDDFITIKDLLGLCLARWKWFVLSLVLCVGTAVIYLLKTPPVYTRSASILIKEDSKGQSVSTEMDFSDLGLFQSNTNVNNEILAISSPATMHEVVSRLSLNTDYYVDGRFHKEVLYGTALPVSAVISGFPESGSAAFTIARKDDGTMELYDFEKNGEDIKSSPVRVSSGKAVRTPLGEITVSGNPFSNDTTWRIIYVSVRGVSAAAADYSSRLSVALAEDKASVINLSIQDRSIQRAEDVLNTLIAVYNEKWVKDKNQIAVSTSVFINERLAIIEGELGVVDEDISSYKSEHMIPDLEAASSMYLAQSSETNAQILDLNNRLYMTRYIRDHLANEANRYGLLPAAGTESSSIESQISEYNTLLLQRNNLVASSSTSNPIVVDMDQSLDAMRRAIITSLDNHMIMLQNQLSTLQSTEQKATDRIAATPDQAKYLLSVERQQKVKEALYLFLLQKREENELSQAFTAYNTRIITPPTGSGAPTAPVKKNILLVAIALGILVPVVVVFALESSNTKVRGRKDVEGLSMPFVGEIPLYGKRKSTLQKLAMFFRKRNTRHDDEESHILVKEGSRNMINEAFRVLRTNLEFMARKDGHTDVTVVTSFNPGSGKTFITMNLAMSLALRNQRVLVIDGDLRRGTASRFVGSPKSGLSDWLGGRIASYRSLIVPYPTKKNLEVLPIGTIPPNPTELISDGNMSAMVDELRGNYDYIFIDCPPVEIVADTQIFERLADRTIFIARAGLLERGMLAQLEEIYRQGQYKNLSLVLNGTMSGGHYGYRYGYKYGYHYGYHSYSYYGEQ